jgi:hypothetical protein
LKTQKYLACARFRSNNKSKISLFFSGVFLIFVLLSCASAQIGRYNPDPALAKGVLENVSFSNDIAIINDQPSTEDHLIRFQEAVVNYNKFTQSVVDALKMELERNGIRVKDSSERQLYVKVTNVDLQLRLPNIRAYIDTEVRTGKGHIEFFEMTRASYSATLTPTKPLDAAFKDLVGNIMTNKQIQEYIRN